MKKLVYLLSILLLSFSITQAQDNLWRTLASVSFTKIMDNELGYEIKFPAFNEEIKALNGKEVTIKGYIIPLEEDLGYFAFSAFPFQNCFFCGNAGIETVIEVYAPKEIDYTPKAITLKGKLELNEKDMMEHLLYILRDAKIVKD
ncbi:hypothetical protein N9933_03770 [bacterium]|nr:hypothetical protein [bacterium]